MPGEVLGSRRESEPLLGGAPRGQMLRLVAGCAVLGLVAAVLLVALADGPGWAVARAGVGVAVVAFTVGWRVLRVRHRGGRLP
ncbi:hypothetical protein [Aquipuribacter nitratireducens]|uniref:Uncharacterized protein n=1 Tax=Aquipuribacter nitratireducens TaxID=650104 RepID=A0ABW0GLK5_9MICO